jgi:hypothetical protein
MIGGFQKVLAISALIVVGLPVLFFGIQDAFGWYGYRTFTSHLEVGMTPQRVGDLIKSTGGSDNGRYQGVTDNTTAHVWYYYNVLPCWASGKMVTLHFDLGQLQNWDSNDSVDGCQL